MTCDQTAAADGKAFDPDSIRKVLADFANVIDITDADIALISG